MSIEQEGPSEAELTGSINNEAAEDTSANQVIEGGSPESQPDVWGQAEIDSKVSWLSSVDGGYLRTQDPVFQTSPDGVKYWEVHLTTNAGFDVDMNILADGRISLRHSRLDSSRDLGSQIGDAKEVMRVMESFGPINPGNRIYDNNGKEISLENIYTLAGSSQLPPPGNTPPVYGKQLETGKTIVVDPLTGRAAGPGSSAYENARQQNKLP